MTSMLLILLTSISLFDWDKKIEPPTPLTAEEQRIILERHDYWRAEVGITGQMEWSDEMARLAANWAKNLKKRGCAFEHRPDNDFGENLFMGTSGYFTAQYVIDAWASEKKDYNYAKNTCQPGEICGHYTQIVWASTTKVGCAKITCGDNDIWVCNYDPPGNWVGEKPY